MMLIIHQIILACPSHMWPSFSADAPLLKPIKNATDMFALAHIYLKTSSKLKRQHIITDTKLGQIVAIKENLLMLYVSGQMAQYHNNMHMNHKELWLKELCEQLEQHCPDIEVDWSFWPLGPKFYYWKNAVSYWRPNAGGKSLMNECVIPHPTELPNLCIVGEQFSEYQGWAEGALQTAEVALRYILYDKQPHTIYFETDKKKQPKHTINIGGRLIDLSSWWNRHPGSTEPLKKHEHDDDALSVFERVHKHAPDAFVHLLSLQKGFI